MLATLDAFHVEHRLLYWVIMIVVAGLVFVILDSLAETVRVRRGATRRPFADLVETSVGHTLPIACIIVAADTYQSYGLVSLAGILFAVYAVSYAAWRGVCWTLRHLVRQPRTPQA